jgi:hypothetical protein
MNTRKSPIQSATLYKVGTKKKGLDGNMWIITETTNKVKRWVKFDNKKFDNKKTSKKSSKIIIKPKGKKYLTHDNGGRPFQVIIDKNKVHIYKLSDDDIDKKQNYDKLIKSYTVLKVHIGKDSSNPKVYDGNSVLLELANNKMVFIGDCIYEFELAPDDTVQKYFSQVGNSDVPYPVLLGKNYFYSMVEKKYCSRSEFPSNYKISDFEDAHSYYYGTFTKKGWVSPIKKIKKLPKLKMIHKKLW